ncbi:MAG: type II toxin-antitoxin system prevent-host-death family antitoxin [Aliidongia sp.]
MATSPLDIDTMPRHSSTQVKNNWAELVREVRQSGSVAITNHSKVEMVLVEADQYRDMAAQIEAKRLRDQAILDELTRRFDAQLAVLQQPDLEKKIQAMFDAGGKLKNRPKAGTTY